MSTNRTDTINNDLAVQGHFSCKSMTAPAGSVNNGAVVSDTAIEQTKLEHRDPRWTDFGKHKTQSPVTEERIVLVAKRAGTLESFTCLLNVCGTTGDCDFDLKVNGVSVLSAVVNIDNADTDAAPKTGTISSSALAANDVVTISVTNNSSNDGTGPYAELEYSYSGQAI